MDTEGRGIITRCRGHLSTCAEWLKHNKLKVYSWLGLSGIILIYVFFIPALLIIPPFLAEGFVPAYELISYTDEDPLGAKRQKKLESEINALTRKVDRLTPGNAYLVVNTTENKFFLFRNKELIREGMCSTGSMIKLEGSDEQNWFFRTPRGDYKVQGKIENPVWRKPDWAFIEEGLPVPAADHSSRYERGVLGDYALLLGDGYMIHGTLYQRFIGLPVTHGCVRLLDDDLEVVFKTLPVGSKIFIY